MPRVLFVHTVRTLVDDFDRKVRQAIPSAEPFHLLDEPLLERIRERGHVAGEDLERLQSHLAVGAEIGAAAALVTCSTLSQYTLQAAKNARLKVIAIDETLIDAILDTRGSIGVLATNPTTLEPTRRFLAARAEETARSSRAVIELIGDAFAALKRGDQETHNELVRDAIRKALHRYEHVALAQASMARAAESLPEDQRSRVLTSPDLAIARLASVLQ